MNNLTPIITGRAINEHTMSILNNYLLIGALKLKPDQSKQVFLMFLAYTSW